MLPSSICACGKSGGSALSDDLPGFSAKDNAKPPTKRELARKERDYRALVTWYATGDESKVRDILKLPSKAAARVAINRAVDEWHSEQENHVRRVRTMADHLTLMSARKLAEEIEAGHVGRIKDLMSVVDRIEKLHGIGAGKDDADAGGNTYIVQQGGDITLVPPGGIAIDTRPPWERPELVEGEVVDEKEPSEEGS
jgi:hypothetical protein